METVILIHVSAVLLSILFFFGRGVMMFRNPSFVSRRGVKRVAESVDTVLFISGVALAWLTQQLPWHDAWLGTKLLLLLLYILLGMVAFHWGRGRVVKTVSWMAAVAVYIIMLLIALTKNPWPF